ncbi:MAG: HD domain-containing protein [Eubacteriales bacterium]|nr:HD domain-containing protein [Eubacteriales bacterium]
MNFERARQAFEEYLDGYDREEPKIKLKIVHTYCVVECAGEIAKRMGLGQEDRELAAIIGLLHDIGRFEQLKRFDSFMPGTMDHAAYGAEILFGEEKMIRRFVDEPRFDSIIQTAIARHSSFELGEISDERTLLHAKLIRDADKLDNCRVKLAEPLEILLEVPESEAGSHRISPKVWKACQDKKSVLSADRVTPVDYWVSYVAQYYDVNFPETFSIMKEENYIPRIVDRLHYTDPDTAAKMRTLTEEMEQFMSGRIEEGR